jgi:succinyl-diaminopimelate desuccinylase
LVKNNEARVLEYINGHGNELIEICSQLIKAKSENPPGDTSEVSEVVKEMLNKSGLSCQIVEPLKGRANVISTIGEGEKNLIICGHMDVVPAGDASKWNFNPFAGELKGNKILGRGAADDKGGVAAALFAAKALSRMETELAGRVTFAMVCDEETGGTYGAKWLLKNGKLKGDMCVITEPTYCKGTGPTIGVGERGLCWFKFTSVGKPAHGSLPALGKNAITQLVKVLDKIKAIEKAKVQTPRDALAPVKSGKRILAGVAKASGVEARKITIALDHYTVNVGRIHGGTKVNVIPEKCEAEVDVRVPIGGSVRGVKELVRLLMPRNVKYEIVNSASPSYTPLNVEFVKKVRECARIVLGFTPPASVTVATSDAHAFRETLNIPVIAFGPGYEGHVLNESVLTQDLVIASKFYALISLKTLSD